MEREHTNRSASCQSAVSGDKQACSLTAKLQILYVLLSGGMGIKSRFVHLSFS
jgi:hypothetical protein